jgi:hypothetical protein
MKERPILFTGPMVRALLNGTKTQTRRIVKHTPKLSDPTFSPYGVPGDRLWVKETFRVNGTMAGPRIKYRADDAELWPQACPDDCPDWIADDNNWRPSIFMRRYASRISVEITRVRVEQLQDISEKDAKAEGITLHGSTRFDGECKLEYKHVWESINGLGSWALNPRVWVVEFKRVQP